MKYSFNAIYMWILNCGRVSVIGLCLLIFPCSQLLAEGTQGKEFVVTWLLSNEITLSNTQRVLYFYSPSDGTFSLSSGTTGTGSINGGNIENIEDGNNNTCTSINDVRDANMIKNAAIFITTTSEANVYALMNQKKGDGGSGVAALDITTLLPLDILDTGYILQTYPGKYPAFSVVAIEAGTNVTITPSTTANLIGNPSGGQITVSLNRGDVYTNVTNSTSIDAPYNLSGTRIKSNKPIAVFQSTTETRVPNGSGNVDYTWGQVYPISTLGKEYIVVRSSNTFSKPDRVLITALRDGTEIFINGSRVAGLSKYQTHEHTLSEGACYISASKYVACSRFTGSGNDPSAVMVPPLSQMIKSSTVRVKDPAYLKNIDKVYVNLVMEASARETMLQDGSPISVSDAVPGMSGNIKYYYATVDVSSGSGVVDKTFANTGGFLGIVSGFTTSTEANTATAFSYLMGSGIKRENSLTVYPDGEIEPAVKKDTTLGGCTSVAFDGKVYTKDTTFEISSDEFGNRKVTINVYPAPTIHTEDSTCTGEGYVWRGKVYTRPGTYTDIHGKTTHGCDSTYQLFLRRRSDCEDEDEYQTTFQCDGVEMYRTIRRQKANSENNKSFVK